MQLRTPGVYIQEIPVFPPSVAEVETAIPAFIGYTEKAEKNGQPLDFVPTKIYSMKEFEQYYGGPLADEITVNVKEDAQAPGTFVVTQFVPPDTLFNLYFSLKMYYANGGGPCYIVSVGRLTGTGPDAGDTTTPLGLLGGLDAIATADEPTLIVIPETATLSAAQYGTVVQAVLDQCDKLQDRFGVFDLIGGDDEDGLDPTKLTTARGRFGNKGLKYGAVYYPFVKTTFNYPVAGEGTDTEGSNVQVKKAGVATAVTLASLKTTETALYNTVRAALKEHPQSFIVLPPSPALSPAVRGYRHRRAVSGRRRPS